MYLKPSFTSNRDLILTAVVFHVEEFGSLEKVMVQAGIPPSSVQLSDDQYGRQVREYLTPFSMISLLEKKLQGRFLSNGTFLPNATAQGTSYACREVPAPGSTSIPACKTITAPDRSSADNQCALEAHNHNWFNADAQLGTCP